MVAGRDDDTPPTPLGAPGSHVRQRGRYRTPPGGVPVDIMADRETIAHPLPPPPVVHRAPTGPMFPRPRTPEAVPVLLEDEDSMVHLIARIDDQELGREVQEALARRRLRVTSSPPPSPLFAKLDKGDAYKAIGLLAAAAIALAGFALDIRDKVKDLSRDIESVKAQVQRLEARP